MAYPLTTPAPADEPPPPSTPGPAPVPAGWAAVAGATAALVALAVGELVTAVAGDDQSLVASVATGFVDSFAASLKDVAVVLFGTNDKAALIVGIVVVAAAVGALTGRAARHRAWVAPVVFGGFAALGIAASVADPLADARLGAVAAVLAAVAGVAALRLLLGVARTGHGPIRTGPGGSSSSGTAAARTRRAFMAWTGAAGATAVVTAAVGRALTGRSRVEEIRAGIQLPAVPPGATGPAGPPGEAPLGIEGLSPYYVANDDFYRIDTAIVVPRIDPADWQLSVTGLVDRPFSLRFDDLLALPMVEEAVTLSCVSNEVGGNLVGNARWQGVPLAAVLERAGVQPGATQVVGVSTDGFTAGFPTAVGLDGRVAMIAVGMNGEALPVAHGFPARLVVAGLYGYVSAVKWLTEIRLTRLEDEDGYWIPRGWSKLAPVKTASRIDVPRAGASLAPGPTAVAGVAWAPGTGIAGVEVQVDDGPWQPARLAEVVSDNTWVQWVHDWSDPPAGRHTLRCRATDRTGVTQTAARARPAPNGATGHHEVTVDVG